MSKRIGRWTAAAALAAGLGFAAGAWADLTVVGPVTRIELAPDGKSAVATVKDPETGKEVNVTITDDLTLEKFKDKRISQGDEIRAKFNEKDGNRSKSFKKTAGC